MIANIVGNREKKFKNEFCKAFEKVILLFCFFIISHAPI